MNVRIGYGEDAHRLAEGRPLIIGGILIPESPRGAVAHSDGDALLHAVADALLSGLALGDIGQYFPDTAPENKNLDSALILKKAVELTHKKGYHIGNIAVVVTLDKPKLGSLRQTIAAHVANLLELSPDLVGVSFKTSEGLAPDHIQTRATILLYPS